VQQIIPLLPHLGTYDYLELIRDGLVVLPNTVLLSGILAFERKSCLLICFPLNEVFKNVEF
jgi:hypothetical protein